MKTVTKKAPTKKRIPRKRPARTGPIDRPQLQIALRRLDRGDLCAILDQIMDLVPEAQLHAIVQRYIKLPKGVTHANLLVEVRSFDTASRAGDFYEDFEVNSKNFSELSPGTECWIGECERLYQRVIAAIPMAPPEHTREALGLLIGLLRDVDDENDIVFWADEGGSWQVSIDWKEIMTFWFKALAATAEPAEYAQEATNAVNGIYGLEREQYLRLARKHASPNQRKAMASQTKP